MEETAQARTAKLIADLWRKNQPQIQDRIAQLEAAATAAGAGTLSPELREEAASLSHKLAGSLGMFGYPAGTSVARNLEDEFSSDTLNPERLHALLRELRAAISPAGTHPVANGS